MVVERIARFLVPEERIVAQHLRVRDRGFEIEAAIRIDGQFCARADLVEHRLDALAVLVERCAADLHLDDGVAALEIAAHLGAQRVVPCRDSNSRRRRRRKPAGSPAHLCVPRAGGTAACRRSSPRVPHRHVERSYRDRALAVTAGLSLAIIAAHTRSGSRFSPVASTSDAGSASRRRGAKRSRISRPGHSVRWN
jgi:hypothetical protein